MSVLPGSCRCCRRRSKAWAAMPSPWPGRSPQSGASETPSWSALGWHPGPETGSVTAEAVAARRAEALREGGSEAAGRSVLLTTPTTAMTEGPAGLAWWAVSKSGAASGRAAAGDLLPRGVTTPAAPGAARFWQGPGQRRLAARLARCMAGWRPAWRSTAACSPPWMEEAGQYSGAVDGRRGPRSGPSPPTRPPRLTLFGGAEARRRAFQERRGSLARACQALAIEEILRHRRPGGRPGTAGGIPVRALGLPCPREAVRPSSPPPGRASRLTPAFLPKSTIFAAYAACGVLPVCAGRRSRSTRRFRPARAAGARARAATTGRDRRHRRPRHRLVPRARPARLAAAIHRLLGEGRGTMKILFGSTAFLPQIGGLEINTSSLAEWMHLAGHGGPLNHTPAPGYPEPPGCRSSATFSRERLRWKGPAGATSSTRPTSLHDLWPAILVHRPWVVSHHSWYTRSDGRIAWRDRLKRYLASPAARSRSATPLRRGPPDPLDRDPHNAYRHELFRRGGRGGRGTLVFLGRLVSDRAVAPGPRNAGGRRAAEPDGDRRRAGAAAARAQAARLGLGDQVEFLGTRAGTKAGRLLNRHRTSSSSPRAEPHSAWWRSGIACGCIVVTARPAAGCSRRSATRRTFQTATPPRRPAPVGAARMGRATPLPRAHRGHLASHTFSHVASAAPG